MQIYVEEIIFGITNESLCKVFCDLMQNEFEMSMVGEIKFFFGVQIKLNKEAIYIHPTNYVKEPLKKFKV